MTRERLTTGVAGEDATTLAYERRGYRVLARNWRCSIGELDLVLLRGDTLVFCEVKARRGTAFGGGWEAVTARKRQKLRALAQTFLLMHRLAPRSVRFDVASVLVSADRRPSGHPGGPSPQVEIFEDAF